MSTKVTKKFPSQEDFVSFGGPSWLREKLLILLRIAFAAAILAPQLLAGDVNDWPSHDHDAGGQRFSPLKQITPANAGRLEVAWTFDTGVSGLQTTPLAINGMLYVTAG